MKGAKGNMRSYAMLAVVLLTTLGSVGLACRQQAVEEGSEDFALIEDYLHRRSDGTKPFDSQPYMDGTAVVDGAGALFWIKDGVAYAVNAKARDVGPHLQPAPPEIREEDIVANVQSSQ